MRAEVEEAGVKQAVERHPIEVGIGSGFVISPDGDVLTKDHVIRDRERVITSGASKATVSKGVQDPRIPSGVCGEASWASRAEWLGVSYRTEGAFIRLGPGRTARGHFAGAEGRVRASAPGAWLAKASEP